jgi:hypothetical protein
MTKEIALEKYKRHTELLKQGQITGKELGEAIQSLNSCDQLWVIDEHGKWMRANFPDDIKRAEEFLKTHNITPEP